MKFKLILLLVINLLLVQYVAAQVPDTLIRQLDSLKREIKDTQVNNTNKEAYNEETKITPRVYFALLVTDLTQEVTGPFHSTRKTWVKVGAFALIEGGLAFSDKPIQQYMFNLSNHNGGVKHASSYITRFGGPYEVYTLGALGVYGFLFKNEKMKTTTLLASQAYITGGAMEAVIKTLSGRQRPNYYDPNESQPSPTFRGPFASLGKDINGKKLNSSFPSGHTTVAFAAATVYAMEYKKQVWVPVLAYSAATLIGISRMTENKHWATDVFAGAALGYVTGRQVVNNYHRYAKLQAEKKNQPVKKKRATSLSFKLDYREGYFLTDVNYSF